MSTRALSREWMTQRMLDGHPVMVALVIEEYDVELTAARVEKHEVEVTRVATHWDDRVAEIRDTFIVSPVAAKRLLDATWELGPELFTYLWPDDERTWTEGGD